MITFDAAAITEGILTGALLLTSWTIISITTKRGEKIRHLHGLIFQVSPLRTRAPQINRAAPAIRGSHFPLANDFSR